MDIEFAAQFLQLVHAGQGGPLHPNTAQALAALRDAGLAPAKAVADLERAGRLQQNLTQLLKGARGGEADPAAEPPAFRTLLARAGGMRDFRQLRSQLAAAQVAARKAYDAIVQP